MRYQILAFSLIIISIWFIVVVHSSKYHTTMQIKLNNSKTNILFIHHSTGGNLLKYGKVRERLYAKTDNIDLWDHGYNYDSRFPMFINRLIFRTGLSDPQGVSTKTDYNIYISNNSPKEYADIFSRDQNDPTLSKILQYDVVIIKNCFPTTLIDSDEMLSEHKKYYSEVKDGMERFPEKEFIIFTPPPVRKEVTEVEYANRARELANWMSSDEFTKGSSNVSVFNFFDLLADSSGENANMLKREYTPWFYRDSHPNKVANQIIGTKLVELLINLQT